MRRILVIPEQADPKDFEIEAEMSNCPEIVKGIPPALKNVLNEKDLPTIYEEPMVLNKPRELDKELDQLKQLFIKKGIITKQTLVEEGLLDPEKEE